MSHTTDDEWELTETVHDDPTSMRRVWNEIASFMDEKTSSTKQLLDVETTGQIHDVKEFKEPNKSVDVTPATNTTSTATATTATATTTTTIMTTPCSTIPTTTATALITESTTPPSDSKPLGMAMYQPSIILNMMEQLQLQLKQPGSALEIAEMRAKFELCQGQLNEKTHLLDSALRLRIQAEQERDTWRQQFQTQAEQLKKCQEELKSKSDLQLELDKLKTSEFKWMTEAKQHAQMYQELKAKTETFFADVTKSTSPMLLTQDELKDSTEMGMARENMYRRKIRQMEDYIDHEIARSYPFSNMHWRRAYDFLSELERIYHDNHYLLRVRPGDRIKISYYERI